MFIVLYIVGVLWIVYNARQLPKLKAGTAKLQTVTICVPLRNEQQRVPALVHNLKQLRYDNLQVLFYDDQSTDETVCTIRKAIEGDARFTLIEGKELPVGWKGKPHACYKLAGQATGEYLLFIDADVTLYRDTVSAVVHTFKHYKYDAISGFPKFRNKSFLEKLLTPMLHFFVYMHLPIQLANRQKYTSASAASGAFMAMTKECYEATGGHSLVKNEVVEDVTLFRALKRARYKAMLFHVTDYVQCDMYDSSSATWRGFLKNSFAGLQHSLVLATAVMAFYLFYYVAPIFMLLYGVLSSEWVYVLPYICVTIQRVVSDTYSRTLSIYSLFMPLSAAIYVALLVTAMAKYVMRRPNEWKGRSV